MDVLFVYIWSFIIFIEIFFYFLFCLYGFFSFYWICAFYSPVRFDWYRTGNASTWSKTNWGEWFLRDSYLCFHIIFWCYCRLAWYIFLRFSLDSFWRYPLWTLSSCFVWLLCIWEKSYGCDEWICWTYHVFYLSDCSTWEVRFCGYACHRTSPDTCIKGILYSTEKSFFSRGTWGFSQIRSDCVGNITASSRCKIFYFGCRKLALWWKSFLDSPDSNGKIF